VQEVERIAVKPNESHDTLVVTDRKKLIWFAYNNAMTPAVLGVLMHFSVG
jgi:hypothetical protein